LVVVLALFTGVGLGAYVIAVDPGLTVPEVAERAKELAPRVRLVFEIILMSRWQR
jgi:hypothetical protein